MMKYLLVLSLFTVHSTYGALAGGRLNAFSVGENAFAGVVNPANAVWLKDRFDVGTFWVHQKSSLTNRDNNPFFPLGKTDLSYRVRNLFTVDAAIHKQVNIDTFCASFSLAAYTLPSYTKVQSKVPFPLSGTTPIYVWNRTDAISGIFSFKLNPAHSLGFSIDYYRFSHCRNGFQHSDNSSKSVSPGNVTNNGNDHSDGVGFSIGWRWKITENLNFGTAWARKSYCGQYRKYQGYEPHHAKNFAPQTLGAGFTYRFTPKFGGRLEVLWTNLGNLPGANNNLLPDGSLNMNKRGSDQSPGPGLNDATYINIGTGYLFNPMLSVGAGLSHRIRLPRKSPYLISHSYMLQTIYDSLSVAANFNYKKHNVFAGLIYGFKNTVSGLMPPTLGGGRFTGEKRSISLSLSWGYMY